MGEKGEGLIGTIIKDIWTITRRGWKWGRKLWRARMVWRGGGKRQTTVLEQQLKKKKI